MKAKNLKRALVTSAVSLCACVAMLAGSTFAWFTDSVTSGSNTITAGNLDVELYRGDSSSTTKVDSSTTDLFSDVTLWEPGAAAYEVLTIANEGTLDLRYSLQISITSENSIYGYKLSDVLQIGYVEYTDTIAGYITNKNRTNVVGSISNYSSFSSGLTISDTLYTKDNTVTYLVVVYWEPGDNDNNYNTSTGLKIDFTAKLLATQAPSESDGFGDDYDENATIEKDGVSYTTVSNKETLTSLISSASSSGEAVNVALTKNITLDSTDSFTVAAGADVSIDLNGKELDVSALTSTITLNEGSSLTISDGDFVLGVGSIQDYSCTSLYVYKSDLTLENVNASSTTTMAWPVGSTASINIVNSTLTSHGYYLIGTNADTKKDLDNSGLSYGKDFEINISNSILTANANSDNDESYDASTVLINVPCTLNINDSVITGTRHGVIVRGGTANITNSTVTTTGEWVTKGGGTADKHMDSNWGSGNEVPMAALVVGNRSSSAYRYAASCTLSNVNVINELYTGDNDTDDYYAIYAWGNSETDMGAYVTVTGSCNYTGLIKKANDYVTFSGITETNIAVSTAAEAVSALSSNTNEDVTLVLNSNITLTASQINTAVQSTTATETIIDVSDSSATLEISSGSVTVENNNILTIFGDGTGDASNPDVVANNASGATANINVKKDSTVTLSDVYVEGEGCVLYPQGDAAEVNVIDSTIYTTGVYGVGTNASDPSYYGVVVNIENSTIQVAADDGDSCAVMINGDSTLSVKDSTIIGQKQALLVRAGTATVTNTKIINELYYIANDIDNVIGYTQGNQWGSGNNLAFGAVVVGNNAANSGAYCANAELTMTDCEISCTVSSNYTRTTSLADYTIGLYMTQKKTDDSTNYKTYVTLNNTSITGMVVNICGSNQTSELEGYTGTVYTSYNGGWQTT